MLHNDLLLIQVNIQKSKKERTIQKLTKLQVIFECLTLQEKKEDTEKGYQYFPKTTVTF